MNPVISFRKFYFSYKSDVSEFGINGKGTGGIVSGWQSSGFESEAKYLYLNELNLIFSFSRCTILTIVSASNTTELIIVSMIFGILRLVLSAFVGIGGLDGTQNDSRKQINYSLNRIICNPFWCCHPKPSHFLYFEKSDRVTGYVNTAVYEFCCIR